jgi:hypothetical protein
VGAAGKKVKITYLMGLINMLILAGCRYSIEDVSTRDCEIVKKTRQAYLDYLREANDAALYDPEMRLGSPKSVALTRLKFQQILDTFAAESFDSKDVRDYLWENRDIPSDPDNVAVWQVSFLEDFLSKHCTE